MPAPPPPAKAPPGADAQKLVFAQSVCAAAVRRQGSKVHVGCRGCPPFGEASPLPDGTIAENPAVFRELAAVHAGAFTGAGADQALLQLSGCHSMDDGGSGSVLVEKVESSWHYRPLLLLPEISAYQCVVFGAPSGAVLVCLDRFASGGHTRDTIVAHRFVAGVPPKHERESLVTANSMADAACGYVGMDIVGAEIRAMTAKDVDADGVADLRLDVSYSMSKADERRDRKLEALCRAIRPGIDRTPTERFMPKATRATVDFRFDGRRFVPTAGAAEWVDKLPGPYR
ncbi:MAG: hypothetical protein L6Q84_29640 [Polyangiaceae bacterium]|nr:hypothetical protein [Polyangiaceae bacterium]